MKILAVIYEIHPHIDLYARDGTDSVYIGGIWGNISFENMPSYWLVSIDNGDRYSTICADLIQKGD